MTKNLGDLVTKAPWQRAKQPTIDARQAAAEAVGEYLLGLVFYRYEGTALDPETPDGVRAFQLREVRREWPMMSEGLVYPCASIVDFGSGDMGDSSFTPVFLEETYGVHGEGTVLRKIAELEADFQIDFFANDKPTREAIAAMLPSAFNPDEAKTGAVIQCSDRYYCTTVRATLIDAVRGDTPDTSDADEWRYRTTVRIQIPVLDLLVLPGASFLAKVTGIGPCVSDATADADSDS